MPPEITLLDVFLLVFIGIGPLKVLVVFIALTKEFSTELRRKVAQKMGFLPGHSSRGMDRISMSIFKAARIEQVLLSLLRSFYNADLHGQASQHLWVFNSICLLCSHVSKMEFSK